MEALSEKKVKEHLDTKLKEWSIENNAIKREFKFKTFVEAFGFMASVALEAEKLDHHPDWSNSYNKVTISLTNHEAKGITQLDFDLAATIDKLFGS
ncbi:MAG: 4a-hydroxytetrahydrobiopterin dehydratase [Bacteroidales bacterium]|jgi:4a-hydroxytetrahydrobiopterin dehydratase|nr:4a-hydroxytetrahydrobiopterin dehydratase [Bacteroidales bacterium]